MARNVERSEMKHAPSFIAISLVAAIMIAQPGYGRIGESYRQCVARYGKAVAALSGLGHIQGVAGFEKSGIAVTTLFDRPNKQCFLVLYTRANAAHFLGGAQLTEAQIDSLMASLNVIWVSPEEDNQASRQSTASANKGKSGYASPITKASSSGKPKWKTNMELAQKASNAFLDALSSGRSAHLYAKDEKCQAIFDSLPSKWIYPYRRCGDHLFAFKLGMGSCEGLLLINSDASKAISDWATAYKESLIPEKDRGRPLEGF